MDGAVHFEGDTCRETEVDLRKYTCCTYSMQWPIWALLGSLDCKSGSEWVPRKLGSFRTAQPEDNIKSSESSGVHIMERLSTFKMHCEDVVIRVPIRHTGNEGIRSIHFQGLHILHSLCVSIIQSQVITHDRSHIRVALQENAAEIYVA